VRFTKENGTEETEMDLVLKFGLMEQDTKVKLENLKFEITINQGEWKNNKAHGKGKFWHVDGDIFEGQWADDKANGYGVYLHVNGAKYEGQWKNDLQDGYGIETWADGSRYEGYYKEGKKHGEGNCYVRFS